MKWTYNHCTDVVQRNTVGRFPAAAAFALTLKQKHGRDCDDFTGICSSDPGVKASLASVMWDSLKQSFGLKGSTFNERKKTALEEYVKNLLFVPFVFPTPTWEKQN